MRRSSWLLALLLAMTPAPVASTSTARAPLRAMTNDNREPGGLLRGSVLSIHLVAQRVRWYPEGDDAPFTVVEAFGEVGHTPRIPAPLLRIKLGTTIDVTITNSLPDTLRVIGMPGLFDTLTVAPRSSWSVRFTPRAAGSFLYAAVADESGDVRLGGKYGQLVGTLIVDAPARRHSNKAR